MSKTQFNKMKDKKKCRTVGIVSKSNRTHRDKIDAPNTYRYIYMAWYNKKWRRLR
jgi:hypothetical protein